MNKVRSLENYLPASVTLPVFSTGVMNHVDEDSRPDIFKRTNVKLKPGEINKSIIVQTFKLLCSQRYGIDTEFG